MSTPTYVVKKVGDQYITVPKDACPGATAAWLAGGALLALYAVKRGGLLGCAAALAGAGLIARGALGYNPLTLCCAQPQAPTGPSSQSPSYQNDWMHRATQLPEDIVDEQSMESFPASDPPARTATT